jgi:hypothetical protein
MFRENLKHHERKVYVCLNGNLKVSFGLVESVLMRILYA